MLKNQKKMSTGDTLIEVLFAVTVFSLVAVGSLSIMNQGAQTAQRSLETTLVRQEIDAQAETLRFIHDSYIAKYPLIDDAATNLPSTRWSAIVARSTSSASVFGTCDQPGEAFILNTKTAKLLTTPAVRTSTVSTYAQLRYNSDDTLNMSEGVWIEAVRSPAVAGESSRSVDFHIRACWDSSGQEVPMTLGTIVRLYEPIP